MCGDIPPLPHMPLWHRAKISTGTNYFYLMFNNNYSFRMLYRLVLGGGGRGGEGEGS